MAENVNTIDRMGQDNGRFLGLFIGKVWTLASALC